MQNTEISNTLQIIQERYKHGEFITAAEVEFVKTWANSDYVCPPNQKQIVEVKNILIAEITTPSPVFYSPTKEVFLRELDKHLPFTPLQIDNIPSQEMRSPLINLGTPFCYLPENLETFVLSGISHEEMLLRFTACYIIRESWGKKLCSLPKVNNTSIPILKTYANQWLSIYNLCVKCRDLLRDEELVNIPRAWDLLRMIIHEHRYEFLNFCNSQKTTPEIIPKSGYVGGRRRYAQDLSEYKNPCNKKTEPHMYRLTEVCIQLAERADVFKRDFWLPYIASIKSWANLVERDSNIVVVGCSATGGIVRQRQGTNKKKAK
ncbi:MAG: hypothetical protein KME22_07880 [Hassallia sp. WJT32-NPBG1]|nr:hypothetical protein [Hassallia sp. WJT32-NPBG1]